MISDARGPSTRAVTQGFPPSEARAPERDVSRETSRRLGRRTTRARHHYRRPKNARPGPTRRQGKHDTPPERHARTRSGLHVRPKPLPAGSPSVRRRGRRSIAHTVPILMMSHVSPHAPRDLEEMFHVKHHDGSRILADANR